MRIILSLCCTGVGTALYTVLAVLHFTCRFRFEGREHVGSGTPVILCFWHEHSIGYFVTFVRHDRRHAWISDASLPMRPIHVGMKLCGISHLVMGSSGHGGIEAARQLAGFLKQGYSTGIAPDGPGGPRRVMHKGVLHLAAESELPIVPMRMSASRRLVFPSWDRKWLPLPFCTITIRYAPPIYVEYPNVEKEMRVLVDSLT